MKQIRCVMRIVLNHILFLLVFNSLSTTFALVNLFDKLHLYELKIERPDEIRSYGDDLKQSFAYYVNGSGYCAAKSRNEPFLTNNNPTRDDDFKLEANVLIYSNYEQTLSFLLEINFNSPILIGSKNVEGFELLFELEDKRTACIQIIPNDKELIGTFQSKFRLRIKDPAFLSHSSKLFTFYFGQVTLRALVACNAQTSQLCVSQNIYSHTIQIGIRSADTSISTSSISADDCAAHLMIYKTCILKYPQKTGLNYYIVMHPMSKYFQALKEDLDVSSLTEEQHKQYEKAKLYKAFEVQLADKTLKMSSFDPASYSMLYHFESKTNQKLANGMVFKIVEYVNKDIMYMGIFDEPNEENFCAKQAKKCPCGNSTCEECYDMERPNLPYEFVAMKAEDKRSSCKDPIFKAYDFDSVQFVRDFQSQPLSTEKKMLNEKSASVKRKFAMITDYLPRVCMNIDNSDGIFNLKLIFNDYQQTGQASLFAGTTYTLKLYSFSFNEKPNNPYDVDKYFLITPNHILNIGQVSPNKLINIRNLDQGHYILEVYVNQNSSICPTNECVEESVLNNHFQCVPCRKLVVNFLLEYDMLTSSEMSNSNKNKNAKFNKFKRKFWSQSVEYQVEKIDFQKDKNHVFECSKDSQTFTMDLLRSMEIHYEKALEESVNPLLNSSLSEFDDVLLEKAGGLDSANKNRLISAIVPNEYNIEWSYLRYKKAFFVEDTEPLVFSLTFMFFYIFVGALLIFLMLFVYWLSQIKKDIFKFEKKIVFYLSIDVNQETQAQLKRVVGKYVQILKKSFKKAKIDTIDFKTSADERFDLIQNADWIVYVCCTPSEIKKLSEPMRFGRNSFQDDYNRIHFGELVYKKCINITFNRNVNGNSLLTTHSNLNENEPHELKNLLSIDQNRTFSSLISSSRASYHLLLPEENHVFTKLLTQYDYNTADIYSIRKLLNMKATNVQSNQKGIFKRGFKKFMCDLCFKHLNFQLKRVLAKEYKQNARLFDEVEQAKSDEVFTSDDENFLFRDESSDSQSLFKYSSDNYTSQILRTNSSSSSHE